MTAELPALPEAFCYVLIAPSGRTVGHLPNKCAGKPDPDGVLAGYTEAPVYTAEQVHAYAADAAATASVYDECLHQAKGRGFDTVADLMLAYDALAARDAEGARDGEDAARYRWLRANDAECYVVIRDVPTILYTDELDAAIDSARRGGAE